MQAQDIAREVYELVRTREDRAVMAWEDDRARLLAEISHLQRACAKHERTVLAVKREVAELKGVLYSATGSAKRPRVGDSARSRHITFEDMVASNVAAAAPALETFPGSVDRRANGEKAAGLGNIKIGNVRRPLQRLGGEPAPAVPAAPAARVKAIEVVRNKALRAALPGFLCVECEKYVQVMRLQGLLQSEEEVAEMLRNCSRHKSAIGPPPATPDGFWDLTLHTPDEWKQTPPDRP